MFLPSKVKLMILRFLGHEVHKTAYIGFSYLHVKRIRLDKNSFIGTGNIFKQLEELEMLEGARINRWNRFTSTSSCQGKLVLKDRASISLRHYFDVCDLVEVGSNTIIGGHRSTFFTHSKGVEEIDYVRPIVIGDWCYLGSNLCVAPGVVIGSHCFVGMGAVVVGDHSSESYCLIGGNPAKVRKSLPENAAYFLQQKIIHPHMKKDV